MSAEPSISIEQVISQLSPADREQVREFALLLLESPEPELLPDTQVSDLGELRDQYAELALQKKQLEDRLEMIFETMLELGNPEYLASIEEARADIQAGRTVSFDDLLNELGFSGADLDE